MAILNESIKNSIKNFSSLIYFSEHRVCSAKETFEYTFDNVRVDARCWFDMYVDNGFFAVHFEFVFVVTGVSNVNVQKKIKILKI